MLEIMKLLWSGKMVDFDGQFFNFKKLEMLPAPKNNIPIYVGGFSEPALKKERPNMTAGYQICIAWKS